MWKCSKTNYRVSHILLTALNVFKLIMFCQILSDFANNVIYGVPKGSVLRPLKLYFYLLPMSAILYHKMGYHVYADDTQIYISFRCKQPLDAISKVNSCLYDIMQLMFTNKLKINDLTIEFIVFRFPQLRCDLSGLSENVGCSVNTRLGADHRQLIMPAIITNCSNPILEC